MHKLCVLWLQGKEQVLLSVKNHIESQKESNSTK